MRVTADEAIQDIRDLLEIKAQLRQPGPVSTVGIMLVDSEEILNRVNEHVISIDEANSSMLNDFHTATQQMWDNFADVGGEESERRFRIASFKLLNDFISVLKKIIPGKDLANLLKTEKEPLSKLPSEVADKIGSYLSGKKGSIGAQMSQLSVAVGEPGVRSKGGRKTKKKRSSKRKTYGRRVQSL